METTEFSLVGCISDSLVGLIYGRLKTLCGDPTEFQQTETCYEIPSQDDRPSSHIRVILTGGDNKGPRRVESFGNQPIGKTRTRVRHVNYCILSGKSVDNFIRIYTNTAKPDPYATVMKQGRVYQRRTTGNDIMTVRVSKLAVGMPGQKVPYPHFAIELNMYTTGKVALVEAENEILAFAAQLSPLVELHDPRKMIEEGDVVKEQARKRRALELAKAHTAAAAAAQASNQSPQT
eukprot:TRINITY_DN21706_c0_g1_i1.p1 TRINITY_DN21706_c0_g1~~TRINITY_DN21706_c0_g1_i1.p1  ORF type:complete len:234 (+),score=32.02 TRINITY_DN21706_c0_g1_i1:34-735(+)